MYGSVYLLKMFTILYIGYFISINIPNQKIYLFGACLFVIGSPGGGKKKYIVR